MKAHIQHHYQMSDRELKLEFRNDILDLHELPKYNTNIFFPILYVHFNGVFFFLIDQLRQFIEKF